MDFTSGKSRDELKELLLSVQREKNQLKRRVVILQGADDENAKLHEALVMQREYWLYVMAHPEDADKVAREALGLATYERDRYGHIINPDQEVLR